jgi:hypothetical protein
MSGEFDFTNFIQYISGLFDMGKVAGRKINGLEEVAIRQTRHADINQCWGQVKKQIQGVHDRVYVLPSLPSQEIIRWAENIQAMFSVAKPSPKVDDSTLYLNNLLYQVMKTRDAAVHISAQVVYGFANCGHCFYTAFRQTFDKDSLLSSNVEFPCPPVIEAPDGNLHRTRCLDNSCEPFYHFISFLRAVIMHLSGELAGRKTMLRPGEVVSKLTRMPRWTVFVRSGEDIGVVYMNDAFTPVEPSALYVRSSPGAHQTTVLFLRDQVEDQSLQGDANQEQNLSSWEVME